MATLDPGERDTIARPVEQLFDELERLEVLDESFELDGVAGIDLGFEDLAFRSEPLRDDLVRVHLTGGTASYAVDTDDIPVGDFLTDTFDRFGIEYRGIQESDTDVARPRRGRRHLRRGRRDTGDGWRISLGYTADRGGPHVVGCTRCPPPGPGSPPSAPRPPRRPSRDFLRGGGRHRHRGRGRPAVPRRAARPCTTTGRRWWAASSSHGRRRPGRHRAGRSRPALHHRRRSRPGLRRQHRIDVMTEDFSGGGTIAGGCVEVRGDMRTTFEEEAQLELPDGPICRDDIEDLVEEATGGTAPGRPLVRLRRPRRPGAGHRWATARRRRSASRSCASTAVVRRPLGTWADLGLAVLETLDRQDLEAFVDGVEEFFAGLRRHGRRGLRPARHSTSFDGAAGGDETSGGRGLRQLAAVPEHHRPVQPGGRAGRARRARDAGTDPTGKVGSSG